MGVKAHGEDDNANVVVSFDIEETDTKWQIMPFFAHLHFLFVRQDREVGKYSMAGLRTSIIHFK